jgi:hypothetical protein
MGMKSYLPSDLHAQDQELQPVLCMTAKEIDFWNRIVAEKHWTVRKLCFNPPLFLSVFPISL